jgi:hypothetical protein
MGPGISTRVAIGGSYSVPHEQWIFVKDRDMGRHNIKQYSARLDENDNLIRNTSLVRNTHTDKTRNVTYVAGPARDNIQKATGKPVNQVTIQDNSRPGQNLRSNEMKLYRPQIQNENSGRKPAPAHVQELKEVRQEVRGNPYTERNVQKGNAPHREVRPSREHSKQQHQPRPDNRGNRQGHPPGKKKRGNN